MKHLKLGAQDMLDASQRKKREELKEAREREEEARQSMLLPFPDEVRLWTVDDVGRWLDTLTLSQYKQAFKEATVDGEFLMELRVEDMTDVLGIDHQVSLFRPIVSVGHRHESICPDDVASQWCLTRCPSLPRPCFFLVPRCSCTCARLLWRATSCGRSTSARWVNGTPCFTRRQQLYVFAARSASAAASTAPPLSPRVCVLLVSCLALALALFLTVIIARPQCSVSFCPYLAGCTRFCTRRSAGYRGGLQPVP